MVHNGPRLRPEDKSTDHTGAAELGAAVVEWSRNVPTEGSIELPPDPRSLDAIGRNHSLDTALADLVDNAIDATAKGVRIRFVHSNGRLMGLYVADNGRGMTPKTIDAAMTIGGQRQYHDGDLGHFGLGLKAASFSQARSLTVLSRASGHEGVGRRWLPDVATRRGFHCDIIPESFVDEEFDQDWGIPMNESGTIVRWDDVAAFPATDDPQRVQKFVNHAISAACQHIGTVFHRFLEKRKLNVNLDVLDVDTGSVSPPVTVTPLSPFGYPVSGRSDYPKDLVADAEGHHLTFRCHIWPGRSSLPQFRLNGSAEAHQGLYFYRRDRLLQGGGWENVHTPDRRLQLARVEVDIDGDVSGLFHMNPEKSRVQGGPALALLAESARASDGTTVKNYLDQAEQVFRAASIRTARRKPMIHPGSGLPRRVRTRIQEEIPEIRGEEPIAIRWKNFEGDSFFEIDRENHALWLNKRYRPMLLGGKHGGLNDLPLIKSLLYLLVENIFEGDYNGPRDKDNIELWKCILTEAVQAERQ